jgi:hypothetical protein
VHIYFPARCAALSNEYPKDEADRPVGGYSALFRLHAPEGVPPRAARSRPIRSLVFIKLADQGSTVLDRLALRQAMERVGRDNVFMIVFDEATKRERACGRRACFHIRS